MSVTLKAGLGWGKSRKGSCVCAKDRGPGGHLCVEPRRGRAPGRGKGGNCRIPPTVVQTCQSGGWTGAGAKLAASSPSDLAEKPFCCGSHRGHSLAHGKEWPASCPSTASQTAVDSST